MSVLQKMYRVCMCVFIFSGIFSLFSANAENISGNIIANPGFEEGIKPWQPRQFAGVGTVTLDAKTARTGSNSVKIAGGIKDRTGMTYYPPVDVKPGEKYNLSIWYKTDNVVSENEETGGVMVRLTFLDETGKKHVEKVFRGKTGSMHWTQINEVFTVPENLKWQPVQFYLAVFLWHAEGTVWFDDVTLLKNGGHEVLIQDSASSTDAIMPSDNIIANPGFEEGIKPWQSRQFAGAGTVTLDTKTARTGSNSVKISGGIKDRTGIIYSIDVKPGEKYNLSIWYKTGEDGCTPDVLRGGSMAGIYVRFVFTDSDGKVAGYPVSLYEKYARGEDKTDGWQNLLKEVYVPNGIPFKVSQLHITVMLYFSAGTVWFDDVILERMEGASVGRGAGDGYPDNIPLKASRIVTDVIPKKGVMFQIWPTGRNPRGNPSVEIITHRDKWIPELKNRYGVDSIIVMAMEHGNIGTDLVSNEELAKAIADYQKNGIKVLLYASLMHVSHDLSWHEVVKAHPDWVQRDQFGKPDMFFLNARLCYNSPAYEYCLAHIISMVRKFNPDGIMLDNQYSYSTCYCEYCQREFKNYMLAKFRDSDFEKTFGMPLDEFLKLKISDGIKPGLFKEYAEWQHFYSCAQAIEKTKRVLRGISPDIVVLANIRPIFARPGLIHPWEYQDLVGFEGSFPDVRIQAEGLRFARALAGDKAIYDYEYTWDHPRTSVFLPPEAIKLRIANSIAHDSNPLIVPYGFDSLVTPRGINGEELQGISDYLLFFKKNMRLFSGTAYSGGVIVSSNPWDNRRQGKFLPLLTNHLPFELTVRKLDKEVLNDCKYLFLLDARCVSEEEIAPLRDFVKEGGMLILAEQSAVFDGNAWERETSLLLEAFNLKAATEDKAIFQYGSGSIICVASEKDLLSVIEDIRKNSPVQITGAGKNLEVIPCVHNESGAGIPERIVIHYLNHDTADKISGAATEVSLPRNFKVKKLEYFSPDEKRNIPVKYQTKVKKGRTTITYVLPDTRIYGLVNIE